MCFSGSSSSVNAEENLRKARKAADDEKNMEFTTIGGVKTSTQDIRRLLLAKKPDIIFGKNSTGSVMV